MSAIKMNESALTKYWYRNSEIKDFQIKNYDIKIVIPEITIDMTHILIHSLNNYNGTLLTAIALIII